MQTLNKRGIIQLLVCVVKEKAMCLHGFILLVFISRLHSIDAGACPSHCKAGQTCDAADSGCSECEQAYYGRNCQHRMECRFTSNGAEYRGTRNTTVNGRTCQRWDSRTPHKHDYNFLNNYCRNPDGEPAPWCYTVDPNKRWELCDVPMCNVQCPSPPLNVPNVDITIPPSEGFVVDFNATIGCVTGYETTGTPATVTVTCLNTLKWSQSPLPTCNRVQCISPSLTDNSKVSNPNPPYKYEDQITVVCNTGYTLQGQSNLTCQADKSWSSSLPSCIINECPALATISNSSMLGTKAKYVYQDTVTIKCNTGYTLKGPDNTTCQADKIWSNLPTCEITECPAPAPVPNSSISGVKAKYVYQDTVTILCNTGYIQQGQGKMTCQADKTWSKAPTCAKVKCPNPSLKANIKISNPQPEYEYQDQINIECDTGYTLHGQKTLTCQADKSWSSAVPSCKVNECDSPKLNPNSKIISKISFQYRDVVTFVCETGYFIKGPTQLTCLANKTWDKEPPTCKIAECTLPFLPSTIKLQDPKQNYTYGDVITFSCTEGFEFLGGNTTYCQATAQWNQPFPVCKKINCIKLKLSANLILNPKKQEYSYTDKISFTCEEGYKLSHTDELTCQANRLWDKEEPFCIEICNGLSTLQWIGITISLIFIAVLVSIFVTVLIMRRFKVTERTKDTPSAREITKTNTAFEYDSIDVNPKDDQHIYNLPE